MLFSISLFPFYFIFSFLPIVFFLNFCYTENVCVSNSGIALSSCRHIHKIHKRGYLFHGYVCHFKRPGNHYRIRKIVWYSCQKMQGSAGCGRADCRYCPWTQCAGTRSICSNSNNSSKNANSGATSSICAGVIANTRRLFTKPFSMPPYCSTPD